MRIFFVNSVHSPPVTFKQDRWTIEHDVHTQNGNVLRTLKDITAGKLHLNLTLPRC